MNITDYMNEIEKLAKEKGYNQETGWMFWKLLTELGEFSKAIEEGKSRDEIGDEYADVEHMLLQLQNKHGNNPDIALSKKIKENWGSKKKTLNKLTQEIERK